ncbi:protocadherin beta-15-like isoform X3 [Octopus sinensis]|uniref:Protocadherin beta-15-like isoform X3 n=1 Tax=Octopus sinensis TaxID=2607531 RepID=A0A7E6FBY8_9MOLL|nr:protocadherin beta-15-like isoform X3 [Octopus sinensis]
MLILVCMLLFCLHSYECVDFTYHVNENENPGIYFGDLGIDTRFMESISSKDHNLIWFSQLQEDKIGNSLFNVSKTGRLYTAKSLDAESLCKYNTECSVMVDIAVRKGKSFAKILEVKVIIEDINDNEPIFPDNEVNINFDETDGRGTMRSIPNAVDRDVHLLNSQISYELIKEEDDPFTLAVSRRVDSSYSLSITLENKLDREIKDIYMLQIIAKDGGTPSKHGILDVQISVTDENDNPPIFSQDIYNITVNNRQAKEIPVLILSATDLDSGKNGNVSYYFSSMTSERAKSFFEINKNTGEIFLLKKFKPEKKQTYKLFIEARDSGSPPLSSVVTVVVNVINKQNNAPVIEVNFSELTGNTATISEAMEVGSFIAYVKVVDNDIGLNGQVTCDLQHNKFTLQSLGQKRYKVSVKQTVDRESESRINFTITCSDRGTPSLKTEHEFSLKVTDVNDVKPQFTKETFKFLTYENEKSNFPVGFINATDPDLGIGGDLTYALLSSTQHVLPFEISDYGFILAKQSLDREQQSIYKFKVLVKDNGIPSLNDTANVIVEVMDENDNAPYFVFPSVDPFSLDVYYQPQSSNDITTLRASDRDIRQNAFLKYGIMKGNNRQLFSVNPYTGVLSFSRTVYQNDAGSYALKFFVKDSGTPVLSATTTLSLTLTVSNKSSTKFTAVNLQSDDKIHINLFIIIIVAAVTVSVLLVVSITICIVRRNNLQGNQHIFRTDPQKRHVGRNTESEYSCAKQVSSIHESPDVLQNIDKEEDLPHMWSRGNLSLEHKSSQKLRDPSIEIHCQTLTSGNIPKYSQPAARSSAGRKDKDVAVSSPYYREITKPSHADQSCNKGRTDHFDDLPIADFLNHHMRPSL